MNKEEYLVHSLAEWLRLHGLQPSVAQPDQSLLRLDLVVHGGSIPIIVEAKVAHDYRSKVFPALVGDLLLRAKYAHPDSQLMAAFLIKKFNRKAVLNLEDYARNFHPGLHWFLLDESGVGAVCLHGGRHEISLPPFHQDSSRQSGASSVSGRLFSPIDRRLLKVLLMPGIDPRYWGGPQACPEGIVNLAKAACVSQSRVSKFVKKFEESGYIQRKDRNFFMVRHEELLEDWFHALKHDNRDERPVRSMYGDSIESVIEKLRPHSGSKDLSSAIIGYHMACHLHGVGRSSVKPAMIYACAPNDKLMVDLDLVVDDSGSSALWLVRRDIESVRQGAVIARGLPVCDVLQCYLDVRRSRARGQEQADYILENILMPHFRSRA
jgi:hypothetical protein